MKTFTLDEVCDILNFIRDDIQINDQFNMNKMSPTDVVRTWLDHTGEISEELPELNDSETTGRFVVVDDFNGTVNLVTDQEGNVQEFSTLASARAEADECQNGITVQLE